MKSKAIEKNFIKINAHLQTKSCMIIRRKKIGDFYDYNVYLKSK